MSDPTPVPSAPPRGAPLVGSEPMTDTERVDRLPQIIAYLARQYDWREGTPELTRAAIDLAWQEMTEFGSLPMAESSRLAARATQVAEAEQERDVWRAKAEEFSGFLRDMHYNASQTEQRERALREALERAHHVAWQHSTHRLPCPLAVNIDAPDDTACTCGYDKDFDTLQDDEEALGINFWDVSTISGAAAQRLAARRAALSSSPSLPVTPNGD